jgi:CspA family cold shock protein
MARETGSVRWFNNKKGYGFIQRTADDKDIFVHYSAVTMEGYKTLKTGDPVTFEVVQGEKGPQAANVIMTGPVSEATEKQ